MLTAAAVLRFDPVAGYDRYRVVVEDDRGNVVFSIETPNTVVHGLPTALAAGRSYYWHVRMLDPGKPAIEVDAVFWTLGDDLAKRRAAFKQQVDTGVDGTLHALLAEVVRSLGLRREACDAPSRALDLDPSHERTSDALDRFACARK